MDYARNYLIQFIFDEDSKIEKHKHMAHPGHQYVDPGDTIQFAPRNTDVKIFIPNSTDLFEGKSEEYLVLEISKKELSEPFIVKDIGDEDVKIFPYAVYCKEGNNFAEGGTSPAIIIKR